MAHRFLQLFAGRFSKQLEDKTKDFLLNSPAFCRFAQESSQKAETFLKEVSRAAEPHVAKAQKESKDAFRRFERTIENNRKK